MKAIRLTKGISAIVDDEDYERLKEFEWQSDGDGYAIRAGGEDEIRTIRMHRVIMNAPEGVFVDHINRNKSDNRKANLRLCTSAQNRHNTPPRKDSKSGYKGVFLHRQTNRWRAEINANGKRHYLGLFKDKEDAGIAFNVAAKELHGEFAYLNDIEEVAK